MANAVGGALTKALSQYKQAEKLGRIHVSGQGAQKNPLQDGIGGLPDLPGDASRFKNELHTINKAVVKPMKAQGITTENAIHAQVMGVGNIEQTATATQELSSQLEITTQFLRLLNEGIKDLTRGTMGG